MMIIGALMAIAGVILPLLMVIGEVQATFFLSFISYALSMAGSFLGIIGAALYIRTRRKR
jgi:hypothetical protein